MSMKTCNMFDILEKQSMSTGEALGKLLFHNEQTIYDRYIEKITKKPCEMTKEMWKAYEDWQAKYENREIFS